MALCSSTSDSHFPRSGFRRSPPTKSENSRAHFIVPFWYFLRVNPLFEVETLAFTGGWRWWWRKLGEEGMSAEWKEQAVAAIFVKISSRVLGVESCHWRTCENEWIDVGGVLWSENKIRKIVCSSFAYLILHFHRSIIRVSSTLLFQ